MSSPLVPFIVFAVLFVVAGVLGSRARRRARERRSQEMATLAAARGWSYLPSDITAYYGFTGAPFEQGRDIEATNVVRGQSNGWTVLAFDYRFTTGNGRSERTHVCSVTAVQTGAWLSPLRVAPETIGSELLDRVTGNDIDTESEQFNRTFRVTCADRKLAVDVLNPRMMTYLLQLPGLAWSLQAGYLVIAGAGLHDGRRIDYDVAVAEQILALVPDFVWSEAGVTPPRRAGA